jgi:hypothetical protein
LLLQAEALEYQPQRLQVPFLLVTNHNPHSAERWVSMAGEICRAKRLKIDRQESLTLLERCVVEKNRSITALEKEVVDLAQQL